MDFQIEIFPLNDFPDEVLQHIFSFLSVPDRVKMCLVCKKWLNIINCKYLLRDIVVHYNRVYDITHINMSRNFFNFSFKLILVDYVNYDFFKHISSTVEYISFEKCQAMHLSCSISFHELSFQNLKVLKIIDCDLWNLFPSLPSLTELFLSGNSAIADDGLSILQRSMKNLKILSLYCPVVFHPQIYKRFYIGNRSYESNPNCNILSLPGLRSFIKERVHTLKELNLHFSINVYGLKEIATIENLSLSKISLENCHNCIGGLITLFTNQQNLKILNLNGIMGLNSNILTLLCVLLPNIEELYICSGSLIDDNFSIVFQLTKLRTLHIANCYGSEAGFLRAAERFASINLQDLNVSNIKIENIDLLVHKCKNLVQLDLSQCTVSDDLLHFISKNLIHLRDLSLKKTDITDYGLTGVSEMTLNGNEIQEAAQNNPEPLSNLKRLKKLQLSYCENITDYGIAFAIRFQYLEYLDLTGCIIASDNTIRTLLEQNPNLGKKSRDRLNQILLFQEVQNFADRYIP